MPFLGALRLPGPVRRAGREEVPTHAFNTQSCKAYTPTRLRLNSAACNFLFVFLLSLDYMLP